MLCLRYDARVFAFHTLTREHLPLRLYMYDLDAFPGRDEPLWSATVTEAGVLRVPAIPQPVRVVAILGDGQVIVTPPLPPELHPPLTGLPPYAIVPKATYPITVELFSTGDQEAHVPLWSRTWDAPGLMAPPPFDEHWPCWARVTYGDGRVETASA